MDRPQHSRPRRPRPDGGDAPDQPAAAPESPTTRLLREFAEKETEVAPWLLLTATKQSVQTANEIAIMLEKMTTIKQQQDMLMQRVDDADAASQAQGRRYQERFQRLDERADNADELFGQQRGELERLSAATGRNTQQIASLGTTVGKNTEQFRRRDERLDGWEKRMDDHLGPVELLIKARDGNMARDQTEQQRATTAKPVAEPRAPVGVASSARAVRVPNAIPRTKPPKIGKAAVGAPPVSAVAAAPVAAAPVVTGPLRPVIVGANGPNIHLVQELLKKAQKNYPQSRRARRIACKGDIEFIWKEFLDRIPDKEFSKRIQEYLQDRFGCVLKSRGGGRGNRFINIQQLTWPLFAQAVGEFIQRSGGK